MSDLNEKLQYLKQHTKYRLKTNQQLTDQLINDGYNVKLTQINQYVNGKKTPSFGIVMRLAQLYGVRLDYFDDWVKMADVNAYQLDDQIKPESKAWLKKYQSLELPRQVVIRVAINDQLHLQNSRTS